MIALTLLPYHFRRISKWCENISNTTHMWRSLWHFLLWGLCSTARYLVLTIQTAIKRKKILSNQSFDHLMDNCQRETPPQISPVSSYVDFKKTTITRISFWNNYSYNISGSTPVEPDKMPHMTWNYSSRWSFVRCGILRFKPQNRPRFKVFISSYNLTPHFTSRLRWSR